MKNGELDKQLTCARDTPLPAETLALRGMPKVLVHRHWAGRARTAMVLENICGTGELVTQCAESTDSCASRKESDARFEDESRKGKGCI